MEKTKHTLGPWEFRKDDCWTVFADGSSIMGDMQYYPWVPDNEADWRLISAAPELLEALQTLEYAASFAGIEDGVERADVRNALEQSRAAIAKATGA